MQKFFDKKTTVGESEKFSVLPTPAWQAYLTGTSGALSATVNIYATNDKKHKTLIGTMTLSVASWTSEADDDVSELIPDKFGNWAYVFAEIPVGGITGTGASVTVIGG